MLVSILANLVMEGGVIPPVTRHNVPDSFVKEEGAGEDQKKLMDDNTKKVHRDDEEILLLIAQWIAQNNSN